MRVAVDITALHDARTGVGVVTHELVSRLASRPDLELLAYSVSWRGRHAIAGLVGPGVGVVTRPMVARPLRAAWRRGDRPTIERFTGPVDVVFGPNFVVPPARQAARVALVHDLTAWRFPELCTRDTLEYPALVQRAVTGGAHLITPTHAVAAELRSATGAAAERVHAVHWAPTTTTAGDPDGGRRRAGAARYLLALGTIEPRKDHVTLVRAFDLVADDDPDLTLVVAGPDGWGVEGFEAALAATSHGDRVRRLGWVDDDARADLLAGAAAFVYPSRYEGFGLPPIEAMAAGAPVVATAVPALQEVLGDAAVLVAPGDESALADGLRRATGAERDSLIGAGRVRAASFSWERAADSVAEVLQLAVSERAPASP